VLPIASKVVYSVHEFPTEISSFSPVTGPAAVARMKRAWGYLVTQDIAPVFVGEMGSAMLLPESKASTKAPKPSGAATAIRWPGPSRTSSP
jgi:endoglucanase